MGSRALCRHSTRFWYAFSFGGLHVISIPLPADYMSPELGGGIHMRTRTYKQSRLLGDFFPLTSAVCDVCRCGVLTLWALYRNPTRPALNRSQPWVGADSCCNFPAHACARFEMVIWHGSVAQAHVVHRQKSRCLNIRTNFHARNMSNILQNQLDEVGHVAKASFTETDELGTFALH